MGNSQLSRVAFFLPWIFWTACSPPPPATDSPAPAVNSPGLPSAPTPSNPQTPTTQGSPPSVPTTARPEAPSTSSPLPQNPGSTSEASPPPQGSLPSPTAPTSHDTPSSEVRAEAHVPMGQQELIRLRYYRPVSEPAFPANSHTNAHSPQNPRPQPAPTNRAPTRYRLDRESTVLWIHTNLRGEFTKLSHQGVNFMRDELESEEGSSLTHEGAPIGLLFLRCSAQPRHPSQERCVLTIHYLINFTTGAMGQYQVEIRSELQSLQSDNSEMGHSMRSSEDAERRSASTHRENTTLNLSPGHRPTGLERQSLRWVAREWAPRDSATSNSSAAGDLVRTLCAYIHERRGTPVGILTLRSDCPGELP